MTLDMRRGQDFVVKTTAIDRRGYNHSVTCRIACATCRSEPEANARNGFDAASPNGLPTDVRVIELHISTAIADERAGAHP